MTLVHDPVLAALKSALRDYDKNIRAHERAAREDILRIAFIRACEVNADERVRKVLREMIEDEAEKPKERT